MGRYAIEEWARLPVEMDIALECRHRNPVVGPGDLVIGITQSGETARRSRRWSRPTRRDLLAIDVIGSQATRDADGALHAVRSGDQRRGDEDLRLPGHGHVLLALRLAELRGTLDVERRRTLVADLKTSALLAELLETVEEGQRIADRHSTDDFFLYLGRHVGLPIALEGALKLKEISYIATDAYAAGEMKHGPIALLDERTPVVTVATDSPVLEKVVSNMQEVRARGAHVIAVATEGNVSIGEHAEEVLRVPATDWTLQPLLAVVPLLAQGQARPKAYNRQYVGARRLSATKQAGFFSGLLEFFPRRLQHLPHRFHIDHQRRKLQLFLPHRFRNHCHHVLLENMIDRDLQRHAGKRPGIAWIPFGHRLGENFHAAGLAVAQNHR